MFIDSVDSKARLMETSVWLWVPSIEKGLGSITGDKVRHITTKV
jgi:hypothetical protein